MKKCDKNFFGRIFLDIHIIQMVPKYIAAVFHDSRICRKRVAIPRRRFFTDRTHLKLGS